MLSLIVAVDLNNAIGYKNELLWHLSQDLKYFKEVTSGHPVIMGRKTYESIGRPLPGRRNIVVTRGSITEQQKQLADSLIKNRETTSFEVVTDMESIVKEAKSSDQEFFVMGGGQLYNQFFGVADRLYVTRIYAQAPQADTHFPLIDEAQWSLVSESEKIIDVENNIPFSFLIYSRNAN